MGEIYFDNSATTQVIPEAAEAALHMMRDLYANPSSLHRVGAAAARQLSEAREAMASILKTKADDIYFTSGGSEGNNTAILGAAAAYARKGRRILISAVEHPSVLEPARALAQEGYEICYIPVDRWGKVDTVKLQELLTPGVILVSVQQVNNENGVIQPLRQIGALVKEKAPHALFHVDGVQGFVKMEAELFANMIDIYTASGHKVHAPKGVGILWLKKDLRLRSLIYGGGQEKGLRSGTENMPGIAAMMTAVRKLYPKRIDHNEHAGQVRAALVGRILHDIPDCHLNTPLGESSPYILNVSFPGVRSEILLHYLEQEGLFVSSGSACHSRRDTRSHVLSAMGLGEALLDAAIRYSFSYLNTIEQAEKAAAITVRAVEEIRSLSNTGKRNKKR